MANEAVKNGAAVPDVNPYELLNFLTTSGISIDRFIENNINNSKAIAHFYIHYKNNSVYKPIIKKIINRFNPNKLFSFSLEARNSAINDKDLKSEINHYLIQSIKKGATNVNTGHNELLQYACYKGDIGFVNLLLKSPHVDPSDTTTDGIRYGRDESDYAIRHAAANGHTEVVKLLLKDKRVDPTARNNFAIRWAAKKGYQDVVRLLLKDKRVIESLDKKDLIKIFKLTK